MSEVALQKAAIEEIEIVLPETKTPVAFLQPMRLIESRVEANQVTDTKIKNLREDCHLRCSPGFGVSRRPGFR